MPSNTTTTSTNAAYNNTFDAVTADDPPRAASPGITLAQSNNNGYHGDVNDHHPVKSSGMAAQPPLIVSSRGRYPHARVGSLAKHHAVGVSFSITDGTAFEAKRVSATSTVPPWTTSHRLPCTLHRMQPSYAQDMGTGKVNHGAYETFISALGDCLGVCGSIPCCPVSLHSDHCNLEPFLGL